MRRRVSGDPVPDRRFFQGLRAGAAALADPERLANLAARVHADAIVCTRPPAHAAIDQCVGAGLVVVHGRSVYGLPDQVQPDQVLPTRVGAHSAANGSNLLRFRHFRKAPAQFLSREEWAAAALQELLRAVELPGISGICLADAEWLLCDGGEPLVWHLACCYRRITPRPGPVRIAAGAGSVVVPVVVRRGGRPASDLDVQWELRDGAKTVARGRASAQDDPPAILINLPGAPHPDMFTGDPRLRVRCASRPEKRPERESRQASGDVLVVRRAPPASLAGGSSPPLQIGGAGVEISRFEAPLEFAPPTECVLERRPAAAIWMGGGSVREAEQLRDCGGRAGAAAIWMGGGSVRVRVLNHEDAARTAELRLTLHRSGGGVRLLLVATRSVEVHSAWTSDIDVAADWLAPGANYVMAGVSSDAGITLEGTLLYLPVSPLAVAIRNTSKTAARFWLTPEGLGPVFVSLDGHEEKVLEFGSEVTSPASLAAEEPDPGWLMRWFSGVQSAMSIRSDDGTSFPVSLMDAGPQVEGWAPREGACRVLMEPWPGGVIRFRWQPEVPPHGFGSRRWLEIPLDPGWELERVRCQRIALWDCYPSGHPDSRTGDLDLPLRLSGVLRAVLVGAERSIAILTAGQSLDLVLRSDSVRIAASSVPISGVDETSWLEFGLCAVLNPSDAEGLWLSRPSFVSEERWEAGD